ncbi:MAG TPA: sigma 54-interacting transcriptional regulator [Terriglobia bacterium]|jgi:transcriptional regulator with GAF, ATPase, and Fis domain
MNDRLRALSGPLKDSEFPFKDEETTVGRAAGNDIVLNDELASRQHFSFWREAGKLWFRHLGTRNGVRVDGEVRLRGDDLKEGSRIQCGSTIFVCLIQDKVPQKFLTVSAGEIAKNQELETLRVDYSSIEDTQAYYRGGLGASLKTGRCLTAIQDPGKLLAGLLDLILDIIPARRGAILINGRRIGPEPADFVLQVYREADSGLDTPFPYNTRLVAEVYAKREPRMPGTIVPPTICVPLLSSGQIKGVLYLEGVRGARAFEPEHLQWAEDLAETVVAGLRESRQVESIRHERDVLKAEHRFADELIGESEAIQTVFEHIEVAAGMDIPVLIHGETGTGKELVARRIHARSSRADQPLVAVNCPAVTETLFESELFGHVKGSFTGATESRDGKFKQADGGTLLLDEIGELKLEMQPKLLRALQEYEFEPVGAQRTVKVDVRVIASTNVDLEQAVREHKFRKDLYQRLKDITIVVPPLRDRREDIPLLINYFLGRFGTGLGVTGVATDALKAMLAYDWPGNIRDLRGLVRSGIAFAKAGRSDVIRLKDLPAALTEPRRAAAAAAGAAPAQGAVQMDARKIAHEILRAEAARIYAETGSIAETARRMGYSERYIYRLLKDENKER